MIKERIYNFRLSQPILRLNHYNSELSMSLHGSIRKSNRKSIVKLKFLFDDSILTYCSIN